MKIIVVSKGEIERAHTLRLLNKYKIPHTVVVHRALDVDSLRYSDVKGFPHSDFVISGTRHLVDKRNWILNNLVDDDEWFIGMDDNIQYFTAVHYKFRGLANPVTENAPRPFKSWRQIYNREMHPSVWLKLFQRNIQKAGLESIPYVGVATMENPYFRAKRFSNYRFVKTKVYAMQNSRNLRFENKMGHDSFMTAQCVAKYGKVLVDSFLHYKCRMYEGGGLGTSRADRDARGLTKYLERTVKKFDGLVQLGKGANTALRFRLTRESSVERWRNENGWV